MTTAKRNLFPAIDSPARGASSLKPSLALSLKRSVFIEELNAISQPGRTFVEW
jgi:hypothetical protein